MRHEELPGAVSLSTLGVQVSMLVGPAAGGLLISTAGVAWAFGVDVVGLVVATLLFAALRRYPPTDRSNAASLASIVSGIRYAAGRRDLLGTYVVDMVAMFMAMPVVLFPALAQDVLEQPSALGFLYTAQSIGTLIATVTSGGTARFHHHGQGVAVAAACWGAAIGLAGLAPNAWVAVVFLALAGAADMISGIFPGGHLAPDDPRRDARPAGRHRAAVVLAGAAGRVGARRAGRRRDECARIHRQRRGALRRRCRGHRRGHAPLLALRRPDRRARDPRARDAGTPSG